MEVIPGSVVDNGNGQKPPKGGGKRAKGERARGAAKPDKTPKGRKDADKQEAVLQPKVVAERLEKLVGLARGVDDAKEDLNISIKRCAEDSGFLASVIRRRVMAAKGENFETKKREVEQLELLFSEVAG